MPAAQTADGGGPAEPSDADIQGAQWRLWFAKTESDGGIGGGDGFAIDPEKAQRCVDELTRIAGQVRRDVLFLFASTVDAPGSDEVSVNAANCANEMLRRAQAYAVAFVDHVLATRDALAAQLESYLQVENAVAARFS